MGNTCFLLQLFFGSLNAFRRYWQSTSRRYVNVYCATNSSDIEQTRDVLQSPIKSSLTHLVWRKWTSSLGGKYAEFWGWSDTDRLPSYVSWSWYLGFYECLNFGLTFVKSFFLFLIHLKLSNTVYYEIHIFLCYHNFHIKEACFSFNRQKSGFELLNVRKSLFVQVVCSDGFYCMLFFWR